MIYLGIDPGSKGGYSLIIEYSGDSAFPCIQSNIWDDLSFKKELKYFRNNLPDEHMFCILEKVHSMPKQGVKSTFTFGMNFGYIKGVLAALEIPYQEVPPHVWKKEFSLTGTDKKASIAATQKLFPSVDLLPTPRSRVPSDGMAESLLLAEYARRIYGKK